MPAPPCRARARTGYAWDGSQGWYAERWQQLIEPVLEAGVPYAVSDAAAGPLRLPPLVLLSAMAAGPACSCAARSDPRPIPVRRWLPLAHPPPTRWSSSGNTRQP